MNDELVEDTTTKSGLAFFYIMIAGLSLSTLGAATTGFSISLWILDNTDSITLFTLVAAVNTIPAILLSPVAGAYVDRWNRRKVLIIAEAGMGLSTLCLAAIYWQGLFHIKYIMLFGVLNSVCQAFILPALSASTVMMVPVEHLTKANGVRVISMGMAQLLAPALAGYLLGSIELKGIFVLALVGIALAVTSIVIIKIPQPLKMYLDKKKSGILSEMNIAWHYLLERRGLLLLLIFYAVVNFCVVSLNVLFVPLVRHFATVKEVGMVLSIGGAGILIGGVVTMLLGNIQHKILMSLLMAAIISFAIVFSTIIPSIYSVGTGIFIITAVFPLFMALSQTVWQQKLPAEVQGRVFGFRAAVIGATMPVAYILSGVLADGIFEPGMMPGGFLVTWFGAIYGIGEGRGLAVMAGIYGVLTLLAVILAIMHPRIRNLETELPDCEVVAEATD